MNYRGIRPAGIFRVLEGNGTPEAPFENVDYVVEISETDGIARPVTTGKIVSLTQKERDSFN